MDFSTRAMISPSLISLLASNTLSDREFAIKQITKLSGSSEFGDNSLRPRIPSLTPKLTWKPGQVQEPSFTCSLTKAEIQSFKDKPYNPPKFSCNTQSTERCPALHIFYYNLLF